MRARAFTLIELLIVTAIIAILLGLLVPGLSGLRHGAKSVKCMANLRVIAFDFQMFANDGFDEDRGESERLGKASFHFEDFVDKSYRISEFWEGSRHSTKMQPSTDPMICPVSELPLERHPDTRCERGAITPVENVSYSFNRRLHQETMIYDGRKVLNLDTRLRSRVLEHPNVPLAFDVDGEESAAHNRYPYFNAPPLPGYDDYYSDGKWWYPSDRHRGKTNVVFVGGYLQNSVDPAGERGWDWRYQPDPFKP